MITFDKVSKRFKNKVVLAEQSFKIENGEFLVLVGPSGSGKTTILKMINRLIDLTDGTITIDGIKQSKLNLRELRLSMGYVLQQIALFPNMTVAENIAVIPEMKGWDKEKILKKTIELLDKVGLSANDYLNRYPKDLSGGEQQRIGIVRAIIAEPKFLLMDEPFSALDPISRQQLQDLTKNLHNEFKMTTVFVTHDVREALDLADRIAVLNNGNIVQIATPKEILNNPANDFVKDLFGGVINE
ncbi:ABC transporter ATP-binding protein [Gemella sp. GH3]|uniref:ABC transporter ATP-binding protein n=1 Tax=unclassified Gemella TaxID=2624949 RepID=UPI0015D08B61|nr:MULTISPECIES: ABC transporter ATP-binding protein [unclassified Gemella]MBF0714034.1 ABC transporter ATP-binding protein [Gemella sp. GH3.1]NYS50986.1 ABC transporter ATP-binding protein [Gemella sp. GH3]